MEETKICNLYKGTVKIKFVTDHADKHAYYDEEGKRLQGVTYFTGVIDKSKAFVPSALNKMAMSLEKNIGKTLNQEMIEIGKSQWGKQSEEAKDFGKQIHALISQWIKTRKMEISEIKEVKNGFTAFLEFQSKQKVKWLDSERLVFSKKYHYPGTTDALGMIGKDLVLFDFKSSKPSSISPDGIYPEYSIQAAGYELAWEEEMKKKIDYRMIIAFNKETGEPNHRIYEENEKDKKAFLACVELKRRLDQLK